MGEVNSIIDTVKAGGTFGGMVFIAILFRPVVSEFFKTMIKNSNASTKTMELTAVTIEKNTSVLAKVAESMKMHDKRAERRANYIGKNQAMISASQSKIAESQNKITERLGQVEAKVDGALNKHADALKKVYRHMSIKEGHVQPEGEEEIAFYKELEERKKAREAKK